MKRAGVLLLATLGACRSPNGRPKDDAGTAPTKNALRAPVTEFVNAGERASETMAKHVDAAFKRERQLGFGAKQQEHSLYDVESSKNFGCRFSTLDHHGKSIVARVACWHLTGTVVLDPPPAGIVKTQRGNETVLTWQSDSGLAAYREEIAKTLGPVVPPSPAPEGPLKDDYETLTTPLGSSNDLFGYSCWQMRAPTEGGDAIRRIGAAGRFDMLRAIARGPSPEGRLFAIDWFNQMTERPTKEDLALRSKIEALPVTVTACTPKGTTSAVTAPRALEIVNGHGE